MALTLKLILGASAIGSALLIAATERDTKPVAIEPDFAERLPVEWYPPSPAWQANAVVPVDVAVSASAEVIPKPAVRPPQARERGCRRRYFTENKHRYWRCRR